MVNTIAEIKNKRVNGPNAGLWHVCVQPESRSSGVAVIALHLVTPTLAGQPALAPPVNSRARAHLTCALSSVHLLRLKPSGVTAPAVLLPAAPANI